MVLPTQPASLNFGSFWVSPVAVSSLSTGCFRSFRCLLPGCFTSLLLSNSQSEQCTDSPALPPLEDENGSAFLCSLASRLHCDATSRDPQMMPESHFSSSSSDSSSNAVLAKLLSGFSRLALQTYRPTRMAFCTSAVWTHSQGKTEEGEEGGVEIASASNKGRVSAGVLGAPSNFVERLFCPCRPFSHTRPTLTTNTEPKQPKNATWDRPSQF